MIVQISRRRFVIMPLLIIFLLIPAGYQTSASVFLINGTDVAKDLIPEVISTTVDGLIKNPDPLVFIYDYQCQSCQQALDSVRYFEKHNPNAKIVYYNLGGTPENHVKFAEYKKLFNTTNIRYPVIFAQDIAISGSSDIIHNIDSFAAAYVK